MDMISYPPVGSSGSFQSVNGDSASTKDAIRRLERQLAKVLLINEAMWEILKQEHGYTDKKLADMINDVDLRDGVKDARNQPSEAANCPSCGRNSPRRNKNCMYCGRELNGSLFSV